MSKLKVGDLVWVSDTVSDIPDQSYAAGCIMTQMDGQNEVMVSEEAWMPDVPNLAAVARVIAANPGIGEAVKTALAVVDRYDTTPYVDTAGGGNVLISKSDWDAIDQGISDGVIRSLRALAAALNGATE